MLAVIRKNGLTLALFAAITTGVTAVINLVTRPAIEQQHILLQKALLDQVVPADLYDNNMQKACYIVTDSALGNTKPHRLWLARKKNKLVAIAVETTAPDGYSGNIQLIVGADVSGKILGTRVTEHHETPGLGDKIELRISSWILSFTGKSVSGANSSAFAVKKEGGEFDQFTGATITPRAVINAVKRTTLFIQTLPAKLTSLPACGENE